MKPLLILAVVSLVAACSSGNDKRKVQEFFNVHIKADDTKVFSYALAIDSQRSSGRGAKRGQGRQGGRQSTPDSGSREQGMKEQMQSRVLSSIERYLDFSEFCQTGYTELYSHHADGYFNYQGRCLEKANEADKEKFGRNKAIVLSPKARNPEQQDG